MNKGLGIVFPKPFHNLENAIHWGLNKDLAENVLQKLHIDIKLPVNNIVFPVGNMFWARVDAVLPLFTNTVADNFPNEKGQADGTTAHAIERLWVISLNITDILSAGTEKNKPVLLFNIILFYFLTYFYFTFQQRYIILH